MGDAAPPPEAPLVLKGSDGRRRIVAAADHAALATGVRTGMPLAKAQAMVEGLIIHDANPDADAEGLEKLAQWALRTYSPIVAADPPDGIVMDIAGAAHLHGGEQALLNGLIRALTDKMIEARIAVADTWGAAHAVARFGARHGAGPVTIVPTGEGARLLPRLSIAALRLPTRIVDGLYALGFETIGELAAQPRAPLVHRFGPELGRRLDQMFGRVTEPVDPVHMPEVVEVKRHFAEPIGAPETIARYTGKLAAQLCDALEARGLGVRQADLLFTRTDNCIEAIRVGMARPMRDIKRLTRLLCDQIETVDPGFGIDRMRLAATVAEPLILHQVSTTDEDASDIAGLIDILSNRIGAEHIYRVAPVQSDVPERSVHQVSPLTADTADDWPAHWPRPVRLLHRPEPISALAQLPDHPPVAITWRGTRHRVVRGDGPERIFGEWWRRNSEMVTLRDYFRVEIDTGERLWLYRTGDGEHAYTGKHEWFLHGLFA